MTVQEAIEIFRKKYIKSDVKTSALLTVQEAIEIFRKEYPELHEEPIVCVSECKDYYCITYGDIDADDDAMVFISKKDGAVLNFGPGEWDELVATPEEEWKNFTRPL